MNDQQQQTVHECFNLIRESRRIIRETLNKGFPEGSLWTCRYRNSRGFPVMVWGVAMNKADSTKAIKVPYETLTPREDIIGWEGEAAKEYGLQKEAQS